MFVRFETSLLHPDNGKPSGILQAINYLEEECVLETWQHAVIDEVRDALEALDAPDILDDCESFRLISWFKPGAQQFIDACYRLIPIYEQHNQTVHIRRARSLDRIHYEDDYQVLQLDRRKLG